MIVHGRVQGVCYRMYTHEKAEKLGLTGWVRNRDDGSVEIVAEGSDTDLAQLAGWCRQGPPYSKVTNVVQDYSDASDEYSDFSIRH